MALKTRVILVQIKRKEVRLLVEQIINPVSKVYREDSSVSPKRRSYSLTSMSRTSMESSLQRPMTVAKVNRRASNLKILALSTLGSLKRIYLPTFSVNQLWLRRAQ